jgi:hypothetical protein
MRFSARSKGGILLSIITIAAIVSAFMVTFVSHGMTSHAASPASTTATYQGKPLTGSQTATALGLPTKVTQPAHPRTTPLDVDSVGPDAKAAPKTAATVHGLPTTKATALNKVAEGSLIHNFSGLSNTANDTFNGFELTPPDQGLCAGHDFSLPGNPSVVIEPVNMVLAEYTPSGHLIGAESLFTLFADPYATGDVRCFYDAQNQAFYFTEIGFDPTGTHTVNDLAVFDHNGFAVYQFDSSLGGTCFGDQPHVGYDNNNLYIATDEFCGPTLSVYAGALLIAISKSQLLQEVASPNAVQFGPLVLAGNPILTLQPAISAGIGTEYLLNSFPYDQFGNNNSIANTLGFWQVKGGQHVTTGGTVTLTGRIITSETYAYPQPAASTGDGSVTNVCPTPTNCAPITSEAFLNPDDSRMQQVQAVNTNGDIDLYASLPTALNIPGDPSARDGVAWFKIDAESHSFEAQGYVAAAGSYLLYPAIYHTAQGTTALVFTITSPTINPSAAYTVMSSTATSFGPIKITAAGAGPHLSFSDVEFGQARWGDYSAAVLDPSGNNLWLATEYIPPAPDQAIFDNWGTRVFEIAGNH